METGTRTDIKILRALAQQVREIAAHPDMAERRMRWQRHNSLQPGRPLILCFPEGAWGELLPESALQCTDPVLRGWENVLRGKIVWRELLDDDNAIQPWLDIPWMIQPGDFGVPVPYHHGANRGSYVWDPPIKDIARDMGKLRFRQPAVDRMETHRRLALANECLGDILPARIRGQYWWTMGLTWKAIELIGLENLMLAMYDDPDGLHRLMGWLRDEHLHFITWFEREGLLTPQNEDDYVGSGGLAYTRELPQADWQPGQPIRLKDLWGFAESQETVGVSPEMFHEFVLPYQIPLLEKFGLNAYGCCEGVHARMDDILTVPRLRRVSVSPWADQNVMAEKLGRKAIFSRKPNPALVCVSFNDEAIRADLRATLSIARANVLEIILKDTHTIQNEPWRLTRWVQIAREEAERQGA